MHAVLTVCKRPLWFPLAVIMTMLSVTYISIHEDGRSKRESFIDLGDSELHRALRALSATVKVSPAFQSDIAVVDGLSRVHRALANRYIRQIDWKVAGALGMMLLIPS